MTDRGSMEVKTNGHGQLKFITAESHKELFKHCAGGHNTVSPATFEKTVKPLLLAHGVLEIKVISA